MCQPLMLYHKQPHIGPPGVCRFYTDAYDLFVIGIAKPMIATVYFPQLNGKLAKTDDLWITGVALVGTLCGQVGLSIRVFCAFRQPVPTGHWSVWCWSIC